MREHSKHSLIEILTDSPLLGEIVKKVEQLTKLNRIVQQTLDRKLAKYCKVANLRDGILILTTPSSTTGHLLRFIKTDLLSNLRADPEWCHLKSIKIHVRPEIIVQSPTPLNAKSLANPILSSYNKENLTSTAHHITSPRLQEALLKLAKRDY